MTWVKTFAENEATERLAEVYAELMKHPLGGGRVPQQFPVRGTKAEEETIRGKRGG